MTLLIKWSWGCDLIDVDLVWVERVADLVWVEQTVTVNLGGGGGCNHGDGFGGNLVKCLVLNGSFHCLPKPSKASSTPAKASSAMMKMRECQLF